MVISMSGDSILIATSREQTSGVSWEELSH